MLFLRVSTFLRTIFVVRLPSVSFQSGNGVWSVSGAALLGDCLVCCCKRIPWCKAALHLPYSIHQEHVAAADLHFPRIWRSLVRLAAGASPKPDKKEKKALIENVYRSKTVIK